MKRLFLLVVILIFTFSLCAQNVSIGSLYFKNTKYSFGNIKLPQKVLVAHFPFINNGNSNICITRVETSCKCLKSSWTKEPIPPKKSGMICVFFFPKEQGAFIRRAVVRTSEPNVAGILKIFGIITK